MRMSRPEVQQVEGGCGGLGTIRKGNGAACFV